MLFPFPDPAAGTPASDTEFKSNYRHLKRLIDKALKEGTPIEELHLVPKDPESRPPKKLSRDDLIELLRIIRSIKSRCREILQCPVPKELERDILAKAPEDRLPWETEALEKIDQWRADVQAARSEVRRELNDHLKSEFFDTE